jgi:hypothetical protein
MGLAVIICTYINAVANSVILQLNLRLDFYNMILKSKDTLYIASWSACPMK